MPSICVIYHSITGTTRQVAEAVHQGVLSVAGSESSLLRIEGRDIVEGRFKSGHILSAIDTCDAVVFGAPTFMGGASAQFKAFADASSDRWDTQRWEGKLAAGFTVGSNLSGDQLSTMQYFAVLAAQHGMLWCGLNLPGGAAPGGLNRLGAQLGLICQSTGGAGHATDLATAHYLGVRIATKVRTRQPPAEQALRDNA